MIALHFRLLLVCVLGVAVQQSAAAAKPNVLFLLADDQRPDTIAACGNPAVKTPHLDELARRGFVFHNAYCMGSTMPAVCNPSRHMLLSGMSLYRYRPDVRKGTFAEVMNQAGYVTWHFGKRGNTPHEYHKAFDHSGYLEDQKERSSGHPGRTAADRAIEFLTQHWDRSQPLFMYVAFETPHDPRVADQRWMDLYDRRELPLPQNYKPFHPFNNGELLVRDEKLAPWPRTPDVVRAHLHDYYACISSLDHHIGRIVTTLKQLGEFDETIIVFSSDHGLAIGSHGLFGKQNLYEHSAKSPLIFAGPGIPSGTSDALVYLFDIFPTVADLVEAPQPAGLDGRSFAPVMRGTNTEARDTVFLAYRDAQRALRHGDWKLIRYPQVVMTQLFNLRDDPHELENLANDANQRERVADMLKRLAQEQARYGDTAPLTVDKPLPADVDPAFFATPRREGARASGD